MNGSKQTGFITDIRVTLNHGTTFVGSFRVTESMAMAMCDRDRDAIHFHVSSVLRIPANSFILGMWSDLYVNDELSSVLV